MEGLYETTPTECVYAECATNVVARGTGLVGGRQLSGRTSCSLLLHNGGVACYQVNTKLNDWGSS